jgi:hypothetical protein
MKAFEALGFGCWLLLVATAGPGCGRGTGSASDAGDGGESSSPTTHGDAAGSSGSSPTTPTTPKREAGDLNAPAGTLGGHCETDSDCGTSGLCCLAPFGFPSGTKYCAPTCSQLSDCAAFAQTSYAISVPLDPDGFGNNSWDSTLLTRGVTCGVSAGQGGSQKYCQFLCVENAAAKADLSSCTCLPRYKRVTDAAGQLTRCDWDDASQCSPVRYPGRRDVCDACNSKPLIDGCYTGKYFCQFNRTFNGDCMDGSLDIGTLQACIDSSTNDCDPTCYEACAGSGDEPGFATSDNCVDLCCKSSNRPATQAPACNDPSAPATDPASGTGGTAGATSSAGASSGGSASTGGSGTAGGPASTGGSASAAGTSSGGASSSGGSGGGANPCVGKVARANYCGSTLPGGVYSTLYTCQNSQVIASMACDICTGDPPSCIFEQSAF